MLYTHFTIFIKTLICLWGGVFIKSHFLTDPHIFSTRLDFKQTVQAYNLKVIIIVAKM